MQNTKALLACIRTNHTAHALPFRFLLLRFLMGVLASLLLLQNSFADIYKTTLPDGTVVYSDQPDAASPSTSEKLEETFVPTLSFPKVNTQRSSKKSYSRGKSGFKYRSVSISSPKNDTTLRNTGGQLTVTVSVSPYLHPKHQLILLSNGTQVAGPTSSTEIKTTEIFRGTHTLSINIIDNKGNIVTRSNPTTIHVHQSSAK